MIHVYKFTHKCAGFAGTHSNVPFFQIAGRGEGPLQERNRVVESAYRGEENTDEEGEL